MDIIKNESEHRFEYWTEDQVSFVTYNLKNDMLVLFHTEVPEQLSGKGIASKLADYVLNYAKDHNYKIKVYCPFITKYIERHPEWKAYMV
jgi:uncharacterized protein